MGSWVSDSVRYVYNESKVCGIEYARFEEMLDRKMIYLVRPLA